MLGFLFFFGWADNSNMEVYAVVVISKNGSLLYHYRTQEEETGPQKAGAVDSPIKRQTPNDLLVLASNLHGIHAIASQLGVGASGGGPQGGRRHCNRSGLRAVECTDYTLFLDQTVTGLKMGVFASPQTPEDRALALCDVIYSAYADKVLKSPFYTLEMPIRIDSFEKAVADAVSRISVL